MEHSELSETCQFKDQFEFIDCMLKDSSPIPLDPKKSREALRKKRWRETLSPRRKDAIRKRERDQKRKRFQSLSDADRDEHRKRDRLRKAKEREAETFEQKQKRLARERKRKSALRASKKKITVSEEGFADGASAAMNAPYPEPSFASNEEPPDSTAVNSFGQTAEPLEHAHCDLNDTMTYDVSLHSIDENNLYVTCVRQNQFARGDALSDLFELDFANASNLGDSFSVDKVVSTLNTNDCDTSADLQSVDSGFFFGTSSGGPFAPLDCNLIPSELLKASTDENSAIFCDGLE